MSTAVIVYVARYTVSYVFRGIVRRVEGIGSDEVDVLVKKYNEIMAKVYMDKEASWKDPITKSFGPEETAVAERFIEAVEWFHGCRPTVQVSDRGVTVSSPGYSC